LHGKETGHAIRLSDPIGRLGDTTIYRIAVIDGQTYEFDHVAAGRDAPLPANQRWLAPVLVYSRLDDTPPANS